MQLPQKKTFTVVFITSVVGELTLRSINIGYHRLLLSVGSLKIFLLLQVGFRVTYRI